MPAPDHTPRMSVALAPSGTLPIQLACPVCSLYLFMDSPTTYTHPPAHPPGPVCVLAGAQWSLTVDLTKFTTLTRLK